MLQMKSTWSLGVLFLALLGNLVLVAPLLATTFTYDFSGPNVVVPSGTTFTSNAVTITAYGFQGVAPNSPSDNTATQVNLFEKSSGVGETGLGISGVVTGDGANEIVTNAVGTPLPGTYYVQLDLSNLIAVAANPFVTVTESVQEGESYQFWTSNALGVLGTQIGPTSCGSVTCTDSFNLSVATPFLSLTAPIPAAGGKDVLLASLTATSPKCRSRRRCSCWVRALPAWGFGARAGTRTAKSCTTVASSERVFEEPLHHRCSGHFWVRPSLSDGAEVPRSQTSTAAIDWPASSCREFTA